MEMHAYRIHHVARLLLKNEGQRIMKEYFNLHGETIPKFLSLSESLDHSLKEVSLNWNDWERFKTTPEYFINNNENLYREYDETVNNNRRKKGKPYFLFEDGVSKEKIQGRVSRIHKTVTTHYKYSHIHSLYSRPSTNPLAFTMYNKISNFIFGTQVLLYQMECSVGWELTQGVYKMELQRVRQARFASSNWAKWKREPPLLNHQKTFDSPPLCFLHLLETVFL
jgi:hypothetical protein